MPADPSHWLRRRPSPTLLPCGQPAGLRTSPSLSEPNGVKIGGVNIMAMDYGDGAAPNPKGQMGAYAIQAANSLFSQLRTLYGSGPTDAQLWKLEGLTPMIGMNDLTDEIFDQAAARQML